MCALCTHAHSTHVCCVLCACISIAKCMFLQNYIVIVLFGLSFLSGGIANVVFATDNGDLHRDLCISFGRLNSEFCSALERVVATEAASGVS